MRAWTRPGEGTEGSEGPYVTARWPVTSDPGGTVTGRSAAAPPREGATWGRHQAPATVQGVWWRRRQQRPWTVWQPACEQGLGQPGAPWRTGLPSTELGQRAPAPGQRQVRAGPGVSGSCSDQTQMQTSLVEFLSRQNQFSPRGRAQCSLFCKLVKANLTSVTSCLCLWKS